MNSPDIEALKRAIRCAADNPQTITHLRDYWAEFAAGKPMPSGTEIRYWFAALSILANTAARLDEETTRQLLCEFSTEAPISAALAQGLIPCAEMMLQFNAQPRYYRTFEQVLEYLQGQVK